MVSKLLKMSSEVAMASGEMAFSSPDTLTGPVALERGLVEQCRQGDAEAFARLVSLHEGMVFGLATRLLGDPEEARDISQDVFLQVYRMLARFEGRSSLRTWIYRIVVNQCRNRQRWWRRRRRDRSFGLDDLTPSDEAKLLAQEGTEDGPYERLARFEKAGQVQHALQRLSFDHRAILLLREVEELSCEEIGRTLGLPEGTVKSRLSRAREALRRELLDGEGATP